MTKIPYVDETFNPVDGCDKCSPGCLNCYAESHAKRFWGERKFTDVQCHPDKLEIPLHWKRPHRIMVPSMGDLFHPKVPFEFVDKVFGTMYICNQHTYLLFTKRIEQALEYFSRENVAGMVQTCGWLDYNAAADYHQPIIWPLPNVQLILSISTQPEADEKIPMLLQIPAAVRGVSVEPCLEEIDVSEYICWIDRIEDNNLDEYGHLINWVVIGAESLNGRAGRYCPIENIRSLVQHGKEAGVPVYVKQVHLKRDGKIVLSRNPGKWPKDLQVQEIVK